MPISIDWGTKTIAVPQSYLTLIAGSLYELDTDQFRKDLKDLEDSDAGMPFEDTHRHNTTVVISGVVFARTFEIINGYTVTFEDLQYRVRLAGTNNNISDVANINQVSILSQNSGGLIVTDSGAGDWTAAEKEQFRDALGVGGVKTAAVGGQLQNKANLGDPMTLTPAERAALTDFLMQRDASSYEDAAAKVSMATVVLKLASKFTLDQVADLARIFKSDGVTPFATQALEKDTSLLPTKTVDKAT